MKASPCKSCVFRTEDCHGSCRQYKLWKKMLMKEQKKKKIDGWKFAPSPWDRESSVEHNTRTGRTGRRER